MCIRGFGSHQALTDPVSTFDRIWSVSTDLDPELRKHTRSETKALFHTIRTSALAGINVDVLRYESDGRPRSIRIFDNYSYPLERQAAEALRAQITHAAALLEELEKHLDTLAPAHTTIEQEREAALRQIVADAADREEILEHTAGLYPDLLNNLRARTNARQLQH